MAASRDWICVRLATYESRQEADFLQQFFGRRDLPNTTCVLLAPDGRTRLSRAHRGPRGLVEEETAASFATSLKHAATRYEARGRPDLLPQSLDFRRALNVASCDAQPLIAIVGPDGRRRELAVKRIARLAWDERFVGRAQYIVTEANSQLDAIEYPAAESGDGAILLIEPGLFGLTGRITKRLPLTSAPTKLAQEIATFLDDFDEPRKEHRSHVREGRRKGIEWKTAIEQTDGPAYRRKQQEQP